MALYSVAKRFSISTVNPLLSGLTALSRLKVFGLYVTAKLVLLNLNGGIGNLILVGFKDTRCLSSCISPLSPLSLVHSIFSLVQADGEAQSALMLGEAISKNPGYLKLRKLKASREIARTVRSIFPTAQKTINGPIGPQLAYS